MSVVIRNRPTGCTPSDSAAFAPVGDLYAATLAHELNQPIGAAANLLRGLRVRLRKRGCPPGSAEAAALELAIEQLMFATGVIGRIRGLARPGSLRLVPLDAARVVEASVALLEPVAAAAGIAVSIECPATPVIVRGDAVALQQVVVNLCRNALEAIRRDPPPHPSVRIRVVDEGHQAELQIIDNGVGVRPVTVDDVSRPLSSSKPGRCGIGLPLSRSLVEAHRGRLWFTRSPDRGTTVHVGIPLVAAHDREARQS